MNTASPGAPLSPASLAKAALRRLALDRLEPTPENYAAAYLEEQGGKPAAAPVLPARAQPLLERLAQRALGVDAGLALATAFGEGRWEYAERVLEMPDPGGAQLATLIDRLVRGVERGGRQWTLARRKENLQRVLDGGRGDPQRLQQRLLQMLKQWDSDTADAAPAALNADAGAQLATMAATSREIAPAGVAPAAANAVAGGQAGPAATGEPAHWSRVVAGLERSLRGALPPRDSSGRELADAIAHAAERLESEGATPALADEIEHLCSRADWVLQHRQHLTEQLGALCHELTDSLSDLAEDDSWAQGQCEAMRARLADGLTARGVKSVSELLRSTRERQAELRGERDAARQALKSMIHRMLAELGELGQQTGRFSDNVGRYAAVVERADSLESLAGVVREMVEESRTVHGLVSATQQRLQEEHGRASALTQQVEKLEGELRRLSSEVSTDPLTQVANRRGLMQAFEAERSRLERRADAGPADPPATPPTVPALAIGLLDIDNFKRLNDELGHAAGDEALKNLASVVSRTLRPTDAVARYGGEEFVVLLPDTPVDEGQQILTRLQRSLSGGLFMHEQKQVLVTFSAGVTAYREGEALDAALERADRALYEAKRTGKNRTCIG